VIIGVAYNTEQESHAEIQSCNILSCPAVINARTWNISLEHYGQRSASCRTVVQSGVVVCHPTYPVVARVVLLLESPEDFFLLRYNAM
jgi:hypothetical protein